ALYEFRKDIFAYAAIAVMFWLAKRPTATLVEPEAETVWTGAAAASAASGEPWLRDGRLSILANPDEIVWLGSAGKYVEFRLSNARPHLIRTTLQAQEARLARFGIVRVHRSRLITPTASWRLNGAPPAISRSVSTLARQLLAAGGSRQ